MSMKGAPKGKYKRWHRFRDDDTKEVASFESSYDPNTTDKPALGYKTIWIKGMGPLAEEHYQNLLKTIAVVIKGVPKSAQHKAKMRDAKLGKPKSQAHREAMRLARLRVLAQKREKENG